MIVPETCIPWIYKQRTELKRVPDPAKAYEAEIFRDYDMIRTFLPGRLDSVLDIGCGLAGIDIPIWHYHGNPYLTLVDSDADCAVWYGYKESGAYYNSFSVTREFLQTNGVEPFALIDTCAGSWSVERADLVISLLSWGYHYPVKTYIEKVLYSLSPMGCVILDVREGTEGLDILRKAFYTVKTIAIENKATRVCCRGKR